MNPKVGRLERNSRERGWGWSLGPSSGVVRSDYIKETSKVQPTGSKTDDPDALSV